MVSGSCRTYMQAGCDVTPSTNSKIFPDNPFHVDASLSKRTAGVPVSQHRSPPLQGTERHLHNLWPGGGFLPAFPQPLGRTNSDYCSPAHHPACLCREYKRMQFDVQHLAQFISCCRSHFPFRHAVVVLENKALVRYYLLL